MGKYVYNIYVYRRCADGIEAEGLTYMNAFICVY